MRIYFIMFTTMNQLPTNLRGRTLPLWMYESSWQQFDDKYFKPGFSQSYAWGETINSIYQYIYSIYPDYNESDRVRKAYNEVVSFVLWTNQFLQDCINVHPTTAEHLDLGRFITLDSYMYRSCTECFKVRHIQTTPFDHTSLDIYDDDGLDFGIIRYSNKRNYTVKYTLSDIQDYKFCRVTSHICSPDCEKVFCPDLRVSCCVHVCQLLTKAVELTITGKYDKAVATCTDISNIQTAVNTFKEQVAEFEAAKYEFEQASRSLQDRQQQEEEEYTPSIIQKLERQRVVNDDCVSPTFSTRSEQVFSCEKASVTNNE